ncbi:hypothetical protein [Hymenobacter algoricola]|uniref:Uncharacterized protein n=1 Tax=Hymenobacter algoricola TaxID=486267 RepID=A0ABP7N5X0_9BACT
MSTVTPLKTVILLATFLLGSQGSRAQSQRKSAPADNDISELNVRVILPSALDAIKDYTAILISQDQDKVKALTERGKKANETPTVMFSIPMPRSWVKKLNGRR